MPWGRGHISRALLGVLSACCALGVVAAPAGALVADPPNVTFETSVDSSMVPANVRLTLTPDVPSYIGYGFTIKVAGVASPLVQCFDASIPCGTVDAPQWRAVVNDPLDRGPVHATYTGCGPLNCVEKSVDLPPYPFKPQVELLGSRDGGYAFSLTDGTGARSEPPGVSLTLYDETHHKFPSVGFGNLCDGDTCQSATWVYPSSTPVTYTAVAVAAGPFGSTVILERGNSITSAARARPRRPTQVARRRRRRQRRPRRLRSRPFRPPRRPLRRRQLRCPVRRHRFRRRSRRPSAAAQAMAR